VGVNVCFHGAAVDRSTRRGYVGRVGARGESGASCRGVAVGTGLSARPPHRSGRAAFPHPAPALGDDVKKGTT